MGEREAGFCEFKMMKNNKICRIFSGPAAPVGGAVPMGARCRKVNVGQPVPRRPVGAVGLRPAHSAPQKVSKIMTHKQHNNGSADRIILTCRQMNTASESTVVIDDLAKALVPALTKLVRAGGGPLPTLPEHTCKVHLHEGYATYEIRRSRALLVSGVVAWTASAEPAAWKSARATAAELGAFPLVMADDQMSTVEPCRPDQPPALPWAATALRTASLRAEGTDPAKVFCLAIKTSEGLMITGPLTPATQLSCAPVARMESLLACSILACALGENPSPRAVSPALARA
jgi:hypothetical protein